MIGNHALHHQVVDTILLSASYYVQNIKQEVCLHHYYNTVKKVWSRFLMLHTNHDSTQCIFFYQPWIIVTWATQIKIKLYIVAPTTSFISFIVRTTKNNNDIDEVTCSSDSESCYIEIDSEYLNHELIN